MSRGEFDGSKRLVSPEKSAKRKGENHKLSEKEPIDLRITSRMLHSDLLAFFYQRG